MLIIDKEKRKDTETVHVDWNDLDSIESAEHKKSELENDGYELIDTIYDIWTSKLIYQKDIDFPVPKEI